MELRLFQINKNPVRYMLFVRMLDHRVHSVKCVVICLFLPSPGLCGAGEVALRMQKCFSPGVLGISQEEGQQVGVAGMTVMAGMTGQECQEYQILSDIVRYFQIYRIHRIYRIYRILSDIFRY